MYTTSLIRIGMIIMLLLTTPTMAKDYNKHLLMFGVHLLITEESPMDKNELDCLAKNIYFEAAAESYDGKLAVATVTHNRVISDKYPNSYCGVVWQVNISPTTGKKVPQFSWTLDGKPDRPYSYNSNSWHVAIEIAQEVLLNRKKSRIIGTDVYNYHATYVSPSWAERMNMVAQIGNHLFYANL